MGGLSSKLRYSMISGWKHEKKYWGLLESDLERHSEMYTLHKQPKNAHYITHCWTLQSLMQIGHSRPFLQFACLPKHASTVRGSDEIVPSSLLVVPRFSVSPCSPAPPEFHAKLPPSSFTYGRK